MHTLHRDTEYRQFPPSSFGALHLAMKTADDSCDTEIAPAVFLTDILPAARSTSNRILDPRTDSTQTPSSTGRIGGTRPWPRGKLAHHPAE
jgi:hypothetical protein